MIQFKQIGLLILVRLPATKIRDRGRFMGCWADAPV